MSEDGSVDFSVGVEITNIKQFADQLKKELMDVIPSSPEIDDKKKQDPNYKKSFEELSEDKKIIHTIGMKFDEIMDEFKGLAFTQNADLMKDIQSALKKLPDNLSVNLANAEGLIEKLTVSVQEMLKSGNIKVQSDESLVESDRSQQVLQEIDTSRLDGVIFYIERMLERNSEAQTSVHSVLLQLDHLVNQLGFLNQGVMKIEDVQQFTKLIMSNFQRTTTVQSQLVGAWNRGRLESTQVPVSEVREQLGRTDDDIREYLLKDVADRTTVNQADFENVFIGIKNAKEMYDNSSEGIEDILDKLRNVQGKVPSPSELKQTFLTQPELLTRQEKDQFADWQMASKTLFVSNTATTSNTINETVFSNESMQRAVLGQTQYSEVRDRGQTSSDQMLQRSLTFSPNMFEDYFRTLLNKINDSITEMRNKWAQSDAVMMKFRTGETEGQFISRLGAREGGSDVQKLSFILNNIQATVFEMKTSDKLTKNMIQGKIDDARRQIAKYVFDLMGKSEREGDDFAKFAEMFISGKGDDPMSETVRNLLPKLERLFFIIKDPKAGSQIMTTFTQKGMIGKQFKDEADLKMLMDLITGDPEASGVEAGTGGVISAHLLSPALIDKFKELNEGRAPFASVDEYSEMEEKLTTDYTSKIDEIISQNDLMVNINDSLTKLQFDLNKLRTDVRDLKPS